MKRKCSIDRHSVVEMRVKYYMQYLLVETPEQVMYYLEKRIKKYRCSLEKSEVYPRSVVIYIQHLINEYTLDIIQVKKYINFNKEGSLKNANKKRETSRK